MTLFKSKVESTIAYGVSFASIRMLVGSTSALYLMNRGLTLEGLAFLKSLQALVMLIADLPLGYIADKFSRKLSTVIGVWFGVIWLGLTAWAPDLSIIYLGEIFNALSLCLVNGSYDALLIDTHKKFGSGEQLSHLLGRYNKHQFFYMALAAVMSAFFWSLNLKWIWIVAALLMFYQALFMHGLLAKDTFQNPSGEIKKLAPKEDFIRMMRFIYHSNSLRKCLPLAVLLGVFYQIIIQYWQPILRLWVKNELLTPIFSGAFICILLVQSGAGKLMQKVRSSERIKSVSMITIMISLMVIGWSLESPSMIMLLAIIILFFALRLATIDFDTDINQSVNSDDRATFFSMYSTGQRIVLIILFPVLGVLIQSMGFYSVIGIGVIVACMILFFEMSGITHPIGKSTRIENKSNVKA